MDDLRTSTWKSSMAVDTIRRHGWVIDINFAKESRTGSLLALAGSVSQISNSLFVASRHGKSPGVVTRCPRNESWLVLCNGGGQPAFYAAGTPSGYYPYNFFESGPPTPGPSCGVALRVLGGPLRVVHALVEDFRSDPKIRAVTRRARSGSAASDRVYYRNAATNRTAIVASFSGTWNLWRRPPRLGMAGGDFQTSGRRAPGWHSRARTVPRTSSR